MKLLLIVFLLLAFDLYALKRPPKIYRTHLVETDEPYLFNIQPLFFMKDLFLLKEHKILNFNTYNDLDRLYLWTTPTNVANAGVIFEANSTLPYPMYSTFSTDEIFESPLTPLLSPPRKAIYNLAILEELYLQDLPSALEHFRHYQSLQTEPEKKVRGWIKDLERRVPKKASPEPTDQQPSEAAAEPMPQEWIFF